MDRRIALATSLVRDCDEALGCSIGAPRREPYGLVAAFADLHGDLRGPIEPRRRRARGWTRGRARAMSRPDRIRRAP